MEIEDKRPLLLNGGLSMSVVLRNERKEIKMRKKMSMQE
jgi:hypothetical protein